jgi:hypothetical protein
MNKAIFMMAAAAITMASCSSDETTDVAKSSQISFTAKVGKNSRGAETTTANLDKMWVTGYDITDASAPTVYFADQVFNKTADAQSPQFIPERPWYWQTGKSYKFIGIHPAKTDWMGTLNIEAAQVSYSAEIPAAIADQKDLIIDAVKGQANSDAESGVKMQFKHILSQLQFKVKNTNQHLTYHIAGIRIVNAANKGSFTFNTETSQGSWAEQTEGKVTYEMLFKDKPIELVTTGTTEATLTPENSGAMIVPQKLTPWNGNVVSTAAPYDQGAYIALLINVKYTADGKYMYPAKAATDKDYGWVAVPVPAASKTETKAIWSMGNKYIYTLDLSKGCGKVDPVNPNPDGGVVDPGGKDPEPGANIFGKSIFFTVTVADWGNGLSSDINM